MVEDLSVDTVVIGAGVVGASCAYHLARAGLRVHVVEAFGGPAEGSTGRSFASIRSQWADPLNIEMSWRSIRAFRSFPDDHGIDVGYRPTGYLLLVPDELWHAQLTAVELQREHEVPVDVLDVAEAGRITPFIPDGIAGATWGPADGVVDPHLATGAYLSLARAAGAQVLFRHPVSAIACGDGGGWSVTAGARTVRAQYVVNAAGGWAGEVAALAGLTVPVAHSRRNIYATAPGALSAVWPGPVPMTIDLGSGAYVRSEGPRLLFGAARPDQPDGYDVSVDWPWMETGARARGRPVRVAGRPAAGPGGLLGGHVREQPGPPRHPRRGPGRADLGQRLRVLRARPDAGAGDRAAGRGAGHDRRDHQPRRQRAAAGPVRRGARPGGRQLGLVF